MKNLRYLFMILALLMIVSCDRDGIWEEFKKSTPWEFHVQVYSDKNHTQKLSGVTVKIYRTTEKSEISADNLMFTKTTDNQGEAVFTKEEFAQKGWPLPNSYDDPAGKGKGVYIVSATKDGYTSVTEASKYLLLNDGHTYHFIDLKAE